MPYYYNPYGYWWTTQSIFYDIPLFLLFFSAIYIVVRYITHDKVMSAAIAAFAASASFIVIRSWAEVYSWYVYNWQVLYGVVVLIFIGVIIYFILKFK